MLIFLLAMVLVPVIQGQFHFSKEAGLNGAFAEVSRPVLAWDSLRAGTYQPALEQYLTEQLGFRAYLVRLHNQLKYSLFQTLESREILMGRHHMLFQPSAVASYRGDDCLAPAEVRFRVQRLRAVQRDLARRGVYLLLVLAPSKARLYPENLPEAYAAPPGQPTNYDLFKQALCADSVTQLDFVPVFARWKATRPYPLFPTAGAHWSGYGATLAADTLLRRLEQLGHLRLPTVRSIGPPRLVGAADSLRGNDNDLHFLMNLMWAPPTAPLAYRRLAFDPPRPGQVRPSALFVGDSFTWGLMQFSPYVQREFANDTRFWYYNHTVYQPDSTFHDTGEQVAALDLRRQLESRRFVVLLLTEHNLKEHEFGFVDQVYRLYHPFSAADLAAIDQLARELTAQADWSAQAKDPLGVARRSHEQAQALYERRQLP